MKRKSFSCGNWIAITLVYIYVVERFSTQTVSLDWKAACAFFKLLVVLKGVSGIPRVVISPDMTRFCSGVWRLKGYENHRTTHSLHSSLILSTRAVEYNPTPENVDRGVANCISRYDSSILCALSDNSWQRFVPAINYSLILGESS